jgi:hypothetical protein
MKKASTWYSLALVILNVLLVFGNSFAFEKFKDAMAGRNGSLPNLTMLVIEYHWWPYLFVGFAIILAVVSALSRWPSSVFYHFIIAGLIIEGAVLCASQIAFILPF